MEVMNSRYAVQSYVCGGHRFEVGAYSDIGTRQTQEDSMLVAEREGAILAAVCDGMGGSKGGAQASRAAVDLLYDLFMQEDISIPSKFYKDCVDPLDARVYFLQDETKRRLQAGTTIVSVILKANCLDWLSVGDSRIYVVRDGAIVQVSKDHNYKEELLDLLARKRITEEQYQAESRKHMALTSYLGIGGIRLTDASEESLPLQEKDIVLLTTDGLYNTVSLSEMVQYSEDTIEAIMEKMVQKIDDCGDPTRDNTSFVVLKYSGCEQQLKEK